MLTTEQCIEIAEKGWLVSLEELEEQYEDDRGELSYYVWDTPEWKSDLSFAEWIDRRVNSWQGFGRTVEAMAERGYRFHGDRFTWRENSITEWAYIKYDPSNPLTIITATHLAALEAINDNQ